MAATGCTATPPSTTSPSSAAKPNSFSGELPPLADPLQDYGQSPTVIVAMTRAEDILANACMKKFGFSGFQPHDYEAMAESFTVDDSRLYGITDPRVAALYGYMPPPSRVNARPSEETSTSYRFVFQGLKPGQKPTDVSTIESPGNVAGLAVPPAGCLGQARLKVTGSVSEQPPDQAVLGHALDDKAWSDAWIDPTTQAAKAVWAACMAKAGYKMLDPLDDIPPQKGANASPAEIQQALADIACKKSTGFVAKANAENVRVANQYLEQNQLALEASKAFNEETLKKANDVIAASH